MTQNKEQRAVIKCPVCATITPAVKFDDEDKWLCLFCKERIKINPLKGKFDIPDPKE
jgi:hypothetical protein